MTRKREWLFGVAILAVTALVAAPSAQKGKNGTTLAASKTINICDNGDGTWTYSGDIAVWNEGAVDTQGFVIDDNIENTTGGGFVKAYDCFDQSGTVIPAGTTLATATTFAYSCTFAALEGDIRNTANVSITNHSGSLGTPKGPSPKATYTGENPPPPCSQELGGCALSQGYFCQHDFEGQDDPFFGTGSTWKVAVCKSLGASNNGYVQLASQYAAVTLSKATQGLVLDPGTQAIYDQAATWLAANTTASCPAANSCGLQKTWASLLDDLIQARHCEDSLAAKAARKQ